jgi:hypothetical protein
MTRKQEHDRIEKLERELAALKAAHEQRVSDDCCCHPHYPTIIYPFVPNTPRWYPGYYPTWNTSGTTVGITYTADNTNVASGGTTTKTIGVIS